MKKIQYIRDLKKVLQLTASDQELLQKVSDRFAFRANDYYLGLINWEDPNDPIRKLVIPDPDEMKGWGQLDASDEAANTQVHGLQHKYSDTALLLVNEVCGAYCRYCFRKRLFMNDNDEASIDISEGLSYIAAHPEITNVLLTGGDPLIMGTQRLVNVFESLRAIPHVKIIRIGSKMPAFNPFRILDDLELLEAFETYSKPGNRIYLMAHFDHPKELTEPAIQAMDAVIKAGVIPVNQCPLIKGINDDPKVLAELFRKLSFIGCPPYYLFQCRPTEGNLPFDVPIAKGYQIFNEARKGVSGLAKRVRYVMSHATGKIEIVGMDRKFFYFRYIRAKDPADEGRFMIFHRTNRACWLDDLLQANLADDRVDRVAV